MHGNILLEALLGKFRYMKEIYFNFYNAVQYQLKGWTTGWILFVAAIMLIVSIILFCLKRKERIGNTQTIALWLLILFLIITLGVTTFTRTPRSERIIKLIPLWSWYEGYATGDWALWVANILNCIMLTPMGILLPWAVDRPVKLWHAFFSGFAVAVVIEVCQLEFKLGWFEWDDMIHNGISCLLGCMIGNWCYRHLRKRNW